MIPACPSQQQLVQGMQQHQQHLTKLIQAASKSKDTPNSREQQLHPLLSLLVGSTGEPWFSAWLDTTLASIYPQPSRTRLDAVLQAYIAAAPANCSHVLQSMLRIPGSTSLNAPLRRDVAVLFRPNPQLHASWQQQGAVCCSIVAFLANHAASHFTAYQQQQQQQVLSKQEHKQREQQQHHHHHHHHHQQHHHHHHHHHLQQQQQDPFGGSSLPAVQREAAVAAQHAGTAIGWLIDCLLQAAPEHKLQLLQIALATFVHRSTALPAQQRVKQQQANDNVGAEPPVKRMCLEQQEAQAAQSASAAAQHREVAQQQAPGPEPTDAVAGNTNSTSCGWQPASHAALLAGLQFLCAVSSCESFQRNTQQLLPLAAVLAAEITAASEPHFTTVTDSKLFSWLLLQLSSQVSAAPPAAAGGAAVTCSTSIVGNVTQATAASAMPAAALPGSKQQQQQSLGLAAPTAPGLTPAAALYQVVQYLSSVGPTQLLQIVTTRLMQAHSIPGVPGEVSTHAVTSAVASKASAQLQCLKDAMFEAWLFEAAQQWRQTRPAAGASTVSSTGSKRGKGRGSKGAGSAAAGKGQALGMQQLMPAVPAVTASWVCKHLVACLCQQAALEWQQQQKRQQQQPEKACSAAATPAVAALAHLLAADGLLLPPSGEVLVSARVLAEALGILPVDLQEHLVQHWQQLLSKQQAAVAAGAASKAAAAGEGSAPGTAATDDEAVLLPWATLQPMLCLLNHISDLDASPVAAFVSAAVCSCLQVAQQASVSSTAAARPGSGQGSGAGSSVKDIMRHVLLPLRFKLQVQARVWLLQQLLCAGQGGESMQGADAVLVCQTDVAVGFSAGGLGFTPDDAMRACVLQAVVELLSKDCAGQLSQGLQLLVAEQETPAANQDSAASAGTMQMQQARGLADAVLQLYQQLRGCEVDVEVPAAGAGQGNALRAAAERLHAILVGDAGAAVCEKLGLS